MDPLIEAMWHNQAISKLPRLPDNVLRTVIQNLDNCGVECLRRVSRKFTALCDEEIPTRPRTYQPRLRVKLVAPVGGPFAWPRFEAFSGPWRDSATGERRRLLQLLAGDGYCQGCRKAREAPDWDRRVERLTRYLYCVSCKAKHPACLFSSHQRQSPLRSRQCIAHEGYIRLCQHDDGIVRWSEISRIRRRLEEGVKNKSDYEIRCEDISHIVPCAYTGTQRSGQRTFHPGCGDYRCIEWPIPTLSVDGSRIWLYWTAHLPVESNGRRLNASALRARITEIREVCGRFLYPAITSTEDVPEMRCFDPNDCDCVLFEGRGNVELPFDSLLRSENVTLCRLNTSRRLYPLSLEPTASWADRFRRLLRTHMWGFREKCIPEKGIPEECIPEECIPEKRIPEKCIPSSKRHRARLDFNTDSGPGHSTVKCWPCHAGDSCLVFDYTRALRIGCDDKAIGVQWYHALDTDSYRLHEDREGFEVYWCCQKECRNYYGRVPGFSRIIRGKGYHRSVDWSVDGSVDAYWSSVVS